MGIPFRATLALLIAALPFLSLAQGAGCPDASQTGGPLLAWLSGRQAAVTVAPVTAPADSSADSTKADPQRVAQGLQALADGNIPQASQAFGGTLRDSTGGADILSIATQYLALYGAEAPVFPGFNGGFYHFLKDSLNGGEKLSMPQFQRGIATLFLWYRQSNGRSALALELMGDLLFRHPDRFIGNYFGCLAYMRGAMHCAEGSPASHAMMEKSIHALEAPSEASARFDRYLHTKIHKALLHDADPKNERAAATEPAKPLSDGCITYMSGDEPGELATILRKAHAKSLTEGVGTEVKKEVDARDVKSDTTFNLYALGMIAVVIGSVVFFWIRIKRASRG